MAQAAGGIVMTETKREAGIAGRHILRWLMKLSDDTKHRNDEQITKTRLTEIATLLAEQFPAAAFTDASRSHVSVTYAWFPVPAEIVKTLGEWWGRNKPANVLLSGPLMTARLPDMGKLWCGFFMKRISEGASTNRLAILLNLIRGTEPEAYEWLIENNGDAEGIRRARGWDAVAALDSYAEMVRADWQDAARVRASLTRLFDVPPDERNHVKANLRLLRMLVHRHAPENEALVPESPPWGDDARRHPVSFEDQMAAVRGAPALRAAPKQLKAEQIAEIRKHPTGGPVEWKPGW